MFVHISQLMHTNSHLGKAHTSHFGVHKTSHLPSDRNILSQNFPLSSLSPHDLVNILCFNNQYLWQSNLNLARLQIHLQSIRTFAYCWIFPTGSNSYYLLKDCKAICLHK